MSKAWFFLQALQSRYALLAVGFLMVMASLRAYHDSVAAGLRTAASTAKSKAYCFEASAVNATSNQTLGFQEIIYMSMDGRTDRSDSMLLLAELTGIRVTRIPGVKGDEINPKALPKKPPKDLNFGQLGCWRAHVDAWYKVVDERLETALILEDDADWDVSFKDQWYLLSNALAEKGSPLGNSEKYPVTATEPYGVGWDMLWVGHCLHRSRAKPERPGWRYADATTLPFEELNDEFKFELGLRDAEEGRYRTLSKAYFPVCTTGYAVTRRGAQRLLFLVGLRGPQGPVDLDLGGRTAEGSLQSLVVIPPLISQWKTDSWQDSEIQTNDYENVEASEGHSNFGNRSARKALKDWAISRDS